MTRQIHANELTHSSVASAGGGAGAYRFGFNGKESDDEISGEGNQYDYGFRIYNPRLGKFLSVDPLTREYPMLTPYQYASNTPIQAIDLDGLEAFIFHYKHMDGVDEPELTIHFDAELQNNGVVNTIHDYYDSQGNWNSRSVGVSSYSDLEEYFPNFANGIQERKSLALVLQTMNVNMSAGVTSGHAALELDAKGFGRIGADFKLGSKRLLGFDLNVREEFHGHFAKFQHAFDGDDVQFGGSAGIGLVGGSIGRTMDVRSGSATGTSFSGTLPGATLSIDSEAGTGFVEYGLGGSAALGLGVEVDATLQIDAKKLDNAFDVLRATYTDEERMMLNSSGCGTKTFDASEY